MSQEQPTPPSQASPEVVADDANYLRAAAFRELLARRSTWIAAVAFILVAGLFTAASLGAAIGAGAAAAALVVSLLIVFVIADRRSEASFYAAYASQRGMSLAGHGEVLAATPLLCRGSDRYVEHSFTGPFAEDLDGLLAIYTYEESTGNNQRSAYRYTIGLVEVPECTEVPELLCLHRSGLNLLEGIGDALNKSRQRILSFELANGMLCCYVKGHKKTAAELDALRAATATVARRLREESLETGAASATRERLAKP